MLVISRGYQSFVAHKMHHSGPKTLWSRVGHGLRGGSSHRVTRYGSYKTMDHHGSHHSQMLHVELIRIIFTDVHPINYPVMQM